MKSARNRIKGSLLFYADDPYPGQMFSSSGSDRGKNVPAVELVKDTSLKKGSLFPQLLPTLQIQLVPPKLRPPFPTVEEEIVFESVFNFSY